jgi:myo-inositol-1(or 4)-monophosphatase
MYTEIINKIKELGNQLPSIAGGDVIDLGLKKTVVTEWDIKIENEITNIIKSFPGEHSVFAEEVSNTYLNAENVWIMDPISNTFNFIHGLPHYSIVLSHLNKGEVIFAVIYDPSTQELFTAEKGKGAYLNGKKIHVSDRDNKLTILIGPHLNPGNSYRLNIIKIIEEFSSFGTLRTFGSVGVHYAYVACGRVDAAITKNSDVFPEFAGMLLVEEAGGRFTDFDNKQLTLNSNSIVATNGKVHELILEKIRKSVI